jgi:hypothetical protein
VRSCLPNERYSSTVRREVVMFVHQTRVKAWMANDCRGSADTSKHNLRFHIVKVHFPSFSFHHNQITLGRRGISTSSCKDRILSMPESRVQQSPGALHLLQCHPSGVPKHRRVKLSPRAWYLVYLSRVKDDMDAQPISRIQDLSQAARTATVLWHSGLRTLLVHCSHFGCLAL